MAQKGEAYDMNTADPNAVQTIQSSKLFKTKEEEEAVVKLMEEAEKLKMSKDLAVKAE